MIIKIVNNKQALAGLVMIALVSLVAATAPLIVPNDPYKIDIVNRFLSANAQYPLGTDQLGRCVLSRLLLGASYSLGIAAPALMALGGIGLIVGTSAAYLGGRLERALLIICDLFMAFPSLVIVLSLVGALGQGIPSIVVAVMFSLWAWYAKVVWSYACLEKSKDYILACIIAGCNHRRIIFRHILPNLFPQFLVYLSTGMASMIIMISGFSFLGLGFESGTPEWGAMLNEARASFYSHPTFVLYPGLCILVTAAGFNLFGEALRDIISPEEVSE